MMPDNTQDADDSPNADARQQRMAAMLGILSGIPGFSNFGKTVIGNQDQQLSGQSQALDDNINQNLKIGQLVQTGQEHHDTLLESQRYHSMEDQERMARLQQMRESAADRAADRSAQLLQPEDLQAMAKQYIAGDKSVLQNLGRGSQGAQNIVALRGAIRQEGNAQGLHPEDIAAKLAEYQGYVAQQRTMGNQQANVEMSSTEAQNMIDQARQVSNDTSVARAHALGWNQIEQWGQKQLQDPQLASLKGATTAVINTWARAINPKGVATVEDKKHGYDLLNSAQDNATYQAVLDRFEQETGAALAAPPAAKQRLHDAFLGKPSAVPASPSGNPGVWGRATVVNP